MHAAENFHQGRFSRSVFANQAVYLASGYAESYLIQRFNPRKLFGDGLHFEDRIFHELLLLSTKCEIRDSGFWGPLSRRKPTRCYSRPVNISAV